mgnify:FL=1
MNQEKESEKKQEQYDSTEKIELCGLWKNENKEFWSGKLKGPDGNDSGFITLKAGEYFTMFKNDNEHPNSPDFNLVIYRKKD